MSYVMNMQPTHTISGPYATDVDGGACAPVTMAWTSLSKMEPGIG